MMPLLLLCLTFPLANAVIGDVAWKTKSAELTGDNTCNVKANGKTDGVWVSTLQYNIIHDILVLASIWKIALPLYSPALSWPTSKSAYMLSWFTMQGHTADGRPVYAVPVNLLGVGASDVYIFFDSDCGGDGRLRNRWFVSSKEPSTSKNASLLVRQPTHQRSCTQPPLLPISTTFFNFVFSSCQLL